MTVVKDVTGAVMPWVVLAGVAVAIYKYRDEILAWLTGGISEIPKKIGESIVPPVITPEGVTIPGVAGPARDIGQSAADWLLSVFRPDAGPTDVIIPGAVTPIGVTIPGVAGPARDIGQSVADWLFGLFQPTPAAYVAPAPSALAIALGLTGDPVSGYTSVQAPISEPSPVVNVYGYPEGVYYHDGYRLIIDPQYYDVSRVDPRGPGGYTSVLWGAGAATWYSPALASWVKVFGL